MEIRQYFSVFTKWWWLILISVAVAAGSSFLATQAMAPVYQSRTTLMVGQMLQDPNPNAAQLYMGQQLAQSYADLVTREPVLKATLEALGLNWGWAALKAMVSSRMIPGTQLLEISVTDSNPRRAQVLADELARQLIQISPAASDPEKEAEREFMQSQVNELRANLRKGMQELAQLNTAIANATSAREIQDLRNRQASLQAQMTTWQSTYAQLWSNLQRGTSNFLSVVEPAQLPSQSVGPRVANNVLLAAAIGLAISALVAFLLEYLDDTIKTVEHVQHILNLTPLGSIAQIEGKDYPGMLVAARYPRSTITEAYRMLRTNLQYSAVDHPLRTLMVTGAESLDGKSLTAANLAVVLAHAGQRVILVDADLRRPTQHQIFELDNHVGLTSLLLDPAATLSRALLPTKVERLYLLASGPLPPNPSELLGSKRMGDLIEMLRREADIVVFDSPPLTAVTDAAVLAPRLDGTLLVVRAGRTRRAIAQQVKHTLTGLGAHLVGVCLNNLPGRRTGYYYAYAEERQPAIQPVPHAHGLNSRGGARHPAR